MTANQIAYLNAQEGIRHDAVTEEETKRHNEAMESLQNDANAINAERNQLEATYRSESNRIQEEYNKWYTAFTEANEKRRRELEAEGNLIKQKQVDNDEWYQIRSSELKAQENSIKQQQAEEIKRWDTIQKELRYAELAQDFWYKNMSLDYQNRQLEEQSVYWRGNLALTAESNEIKSTANALNATNIIWDIKRFEKSSELEARGQDLSFAGNLFKGVLSLGSSLLKLAK